MNEQYHLNFPVFFHCIIKNHSTLRTNKDIINYLLRGCSSTGAEAMNDTECSRYANGTRAIPVDDIRNIQSGTPMPIIERFEKIGIKDKSCLESFRNLITKNQLVVDESITEKSCRIPSSTFELHTLLAEIFLASLECPDAHRKQLNEKDKKVLQTIEPEIVVDVVKVLMENEFTQNYTKPLFWSISDKLTLENLYIYNSYTVDGNIPRNDLKDLLDAFIKGELNIFIQQKTNSFPTGNPRVLLVTSMPGCGKTSLLSKLAHENANKNKTFFMNMASMINKNITLETLAQELGLEIHDLKHSMLVLDSLDEALKNSGNGDEIVQNLCDKFEENNITAIITCRSNLLHSPYIRNCFEITLEEFDTTKTKEWLDNYHKYVPDFKLDEWKQAIDTLSPHIAKVLLIPLILYICVIREIKITDIKSLGQLYDILFDPVNAQIATTTHRARAHYVNREWKILRGRSPISP